MQKNVLGLLFMRIPSPLCATPEQPIVLVTQPRRIAAMTVAERIARPGGGQV